MMNVNSKIPKFKKKAGSLQAVLPLVLDKLPSIDEDKSHFLSFELMTRVGQPATSTKYKKHVRKFEEGTPQQWIDVLRDMEEIWTQNSVNGGTDRASTVRAVVRGESLTSFEAALQEARMDEAGLEQQITPEMVQEALEAVSTSVFPHRALEIQKLWMNRRMFKPAALTTRQTAAAINRLNNALPLFPMGTDASKFSDVELVGLLEWSLPPAWRTKFDLDGYVPTLGSRARLIEACEAIERNVVETEETKTPTEKNNKKRKNGKKPNDDKKNDANPNKNKYYCSEHGKNPSHVTADCYTIKNRAKAAGSQGGKSNHSFSNKTFRKEVNLLSKKTSKKKVLDMYASAVQREQKKLLKKSAKRKPREEISESSDEDSDMSVQMIESPKSTIRTTKSKTRSNRDPEVEISRKKKRAEKADTLPEEKTYQQTVKWLANEGSPVQGEKTESSEEESSASA
jgi:hypothetical protein